MECCKCTQNWDDGPARPVVAKIVEYHGAEFDETLLDEMVNDAAAALASRVNELGLGSQVAWLLQQGVSEETIVNKICVGEEI